MEIIAFFSAFVLIALAELGDKTMLLTLALATRYRLVTVLSGVFLATGLLMLLPVVVGRFVYEIIPEYVVGAAAGIIFIAFGVWMLKEDDDDDDNEEEVKSRFGPFATVFLTFLLAEFGDKTQLATIPLAVKYSTSLGMVWLGATLGMVGVNAGGIVLGNRLGEKMDSEVVEKAAGVLFIIFGLVFLAGALL